MMDREALFAWVRQQYGTLPDYPWMDHNAVMRHEVTRKWYALVLEIEKEKLGLKGEGTVDVVNVKSDPMLVGSLRTRPGFFPAYHMNKEQWISILLDGTVSDVEIQNLVQLSYELTQAQTKTARKVVRKKRITKAQESKRES